MAEPGKEAEAIERLARIGYDNVAGYLAGGMPTWLAGKLAYDSVATLPAYDIEQLTGERGYNLLDVRSRREVAKDRIAGARHIALNQLPAQYTTLDKNGKWLVYCAGGYRSMIAVSFLMAQGFPVVANVEGGINHVQQAMPELIEEGLETE